MLKSIVILNIIRIRQIMPFSHIIYGHRTILIQFYEFIEL